MEHWQFLIQKQGDRTWQTLESPTLKILTGKYRVLARSPLPNTDVEVRVTHSSMEEAPPKRRIFKRLRRTDQDGLMAVIPFTDLKPGIWELRCSGDLMTDMLGQSWQHSLFIKVLPLEVNDQLLSASDDQFELELKSTLIANKNQNTNNNNRLSKLSPEDTIINQPVSPVLLKGDTAEQILQNLIDLALPSSDSWDEDPQEQNISPESPPSSLKIFLERDTYIAQWGKILQIQGYVIPAEENLGEELLSGNRIYQPQLVVELRSPLESQILTTFQQPLTDQFLPLNFHTLIEIPVDFESKLILANINLYGTLTQGSEVKLLGSHPFIITADVTELLNVTAQINQEVSNPPDLLPDHNPSPDENIATPPEPPPSLGLELFNLAKTPKLAQFRILKPAVKKPLPPRVKAVILSDGFSPQLPKLPRIHKNVITTNSDLTDSSISEIIVTQPPKVPPINLEKLLIKQVKTSFPYLKRLKPEPEPETHLSTPEPIPEYIPEPIPALPPSMENQVVADLELMENTIPQIPILETNENELVPVNIPETSPLIQKWIANQGYLLDEGIEVVYKDNEADDSEPANQDHPLTLDEESPTIAEELLNENVISDAVENPEIEPYLDLPEHLRLDFEPLPLPEIDLPEHLRLDFEPTPPPEDTTQKTPTRLLEEIVLDDVDMTSNQENDNQPSAPFEAELELSSPVLDSLPTPQLFLPGGELLAGSAIKVRLELPQASSTVVIKLWVEDYQTRGLLDGPHLLKDLRPTPWGNWEATTQLIVPLGCVEMLLGAIALDVNSQQESHKVTMVKTVIPPNLPTMEVDEVLGL
jgi:hypothetical protein